MSARPIPVRLDEELLAQVEALASDMGLNRSAAIRHILSRAVGQPATRATLVAEVNEIRSRLHQREGVIFERMMRVLYEELRPEGLEQPLEGLAPIPSGQEP